MAGKGRKQDNETVCTDSISLKGVTNPDHEQLQALTSESGPLCAGALPSLDLATGDSGDKAAWEALGCGETSKRRRPPKKEEPAVEKAPKTLVETLEH